MIIPISENHHEYAEKIQAELDSRGIRVETDKRNEKMGYKIREAQLQQIPYMLVVGDNEKNNDTVSVRSRRKGDEGVQGIYDFISSIQQEISDKTLPK